MGWPQFELGNFLLHSSRISCFPPPGLTLLFQSLLYLPACHLNCESPKDKSKFCGHYILSWFLVYFFGWMVHEHEEIKQEPGCHEHPAQGRQRPEDLL